MRLGIVLIIIGIVLILDGFLRIALYGWPGLTGLAIGIPVGYYGIKRVQRAKGEGK